MSGFLNGTDPGLRQTRTPTTDNFAAGVDFTAGSTTQLTLSADPGTEDNVEITFDGIQQHRNTYSVSGAVVTFDAAIGAGVSNVEATFTTTIPAATPADNSVTLAKLADGTQGDILYYGASGAPTLLGAGTSGQFLKTQGTGANPTWAAAGGGKVISRYFASYTTYASTSSAIPHDDTIPQISEGTQILSVTTGTLASASNRLRIRAGGSLNGSIQGIRPGMAFFDGATDAIYTTWGSVNDANSYGTTLFGEFEYAPGADTAKTITVRVGPDNGAYTIYLNGMNTGRMYGGTAQWTLIVEEIEP